MRFLILATLFALVGCKPNQQAQIPEAPAAIPPQPSRSKIEAISGSPWTEPSVWLLTVDGREYIIARTGAAEGGIAIIRHGQPEPQGIKFGIE